MCVDQAKDRVASLPPDEGIWGARGVAAHNFNLGSRLSGQLCAPAALSLQGNGSSYPSITRPGGREQRSVRVGEEIIFSAVMSEDYQLLGYPGRSPVSILTALFTLTRNVTSS
jgi:hypothetical protein